MAGLFPSVFVSHGSPLTAVDTSEAGRFFDDGFFKVIDRPRAILAVSAHWETPEPTISFSEKPETIHDFGGFPEELFQIRYPASGAPDVAERSAHLLQQAGFDIRKDPSRGLDHGVWVPLIRMAPAADIPVATLSVQSRKGPEHHFRIGQALAPLREDGVLILATGAFTHNLRAFFMGDFDADAAMPDWVATFVQWMTDAIAQGRDEDLLHYRERAPFARENHPTDEHLMPLFVALGAGGLDVRAEHIHHSLDHGVMAMDAFAFG